MEKTHVAYSALGVGTTHGEDTSRRSPPAVSESTHPKHRQYVF